MAHLYLRLVLTNNSVIEAGSEWVDVHGTKLPAKVGAIFYQPEQVRSFTVEDPDAPENPENPEEVEDSGEEITETTAPHYEAWAFPDKGSALDKANETLCRKIPATSVLYAEEIWPLHLASRMVKKRISDMQDLEEEAIAETSEDAPAPAPVAQQAPVAQVVQQPMVAVPAQYAQVVQQAAPVQQIAYGPDGTPYAVIPGTPTG